MEYIPEMPHQSAGLIFYYDNMNYINLRKYYSETLGQSALSIIHIENGEKAEMLDTRVAVEDVPVYMRVEVRGRKMQFMWSLDGKNIYQSVLYLMLRNFRMNTAGMVSLQEQWWVLPVRIESNTSITRISIFLNTRRNKYYFELKRIYNICKEFYFNI